MSIFTIKKKNREFAKWWDRWASRLHRNRVSASQSQSEKERARKTTRPQALEILSRLPFDHNL
ncbi:MAG: hypothetical protein WCC04_19235 [Terriglobales bacterium]